MSRGAAVRATAETELILGRPPVGCGACRRAFLAPPGHTGRECPICGTPALAPRPVLVREGEPEAYVPCARPDVREELGAWVVSFWKRPADATADKLAARVYRLWWPAWLVDATCDGTFATEVGFDYQVRSTDEFLDGDTWRSREVVRDRIRWEPRRGAVTRRYDNVPAAALADAEARCEALGALQASWRSFERSAVGDDWIQLPDRTPDEAWDEALAGLTHRVGEDVAAGIDAPHVRGTTVTATHGDVDWNWLLQPLFATWYVDGSGVRRVLLIHPETRRITGPRLGSVTVAALWGSGVASVGVALLVVAFACALIGIALPPLLLVAALAGVVGLVPLATGLLMPVAVWAGNRAATPREIPR